VAASDIGESIVAVREVTTTVVETTEVYIDSSSIRE
jgi:hypothetical protein